MFRRFELVAYFPDCVDEDWIVGVGLDFVSQGGDESVYAALSDVAIVTPDGV